MKLQVETYKELGECVKAFDKGTFNVLFIIGDPGQCKSTVVKKVLGGKSQLIEGGSVSAFKLYQDLYAHRDKPFIFDDCDQLYTDRTTIRLLKCLCQTEVKKVVGWHTHNKYLEDNDIPRQFETKSRVVIIANAWHSISQHVESLEDRGLMVLFRPSVEEVLKEGKRWFRDREIVKFVEEHARYINSLSLRALVVAKSMKDVGMNRWRDALTKSLGIDDLMCVKRLLDDPSFISDEARIKEFHDETGLSRTTWFQYKKRLTGPRRRYATIGSGA